MNKLYTYSAILLLIIFSLVLIGSFKKNIEEFTSNEITEEEKLFLEELKNTEYSKIINLIKKKNITKATVDKLLEKLQHQKDNIEPVFEMPPKTPL